MWFVYFLRSLIRNNWIYVGSTNNIERRLFEHNNKKVIATKAFAPFVIIYKESYSSEAEARQRERFLKRWDGRLEKKKILAELV